MTSRFYHGGHAGDAIYSLYSIMKWGGGELYIGPHDHPAWDEKLRQALQPLCEYQPYISHASIVDLKVGEFTYDFTETWKDQLATHDYETGIGYHFEHIDGIASCSLKKRDLINVFKGAYLLRDILSMLNHDESWLVAPKTKQYDVVCHLPHDKTFRAGWRSIFREMKKIFDLNVVMIGGDDVDCWKDACEVIKPVDLLEAADYINSAKLFIGSASCNYVIAEGLDKFRLVESRDASGVDPQNERGWQIRDWNDARIINTVDLLCTKA